MARGNFSTDSAFFQGAHFTSYPITVSYWVYLVGTAATIFRNIKSDGLQSLSSGCSNTSAFSVSFINGVSPGTANSTVGLASNTWGNVVSVFESPSSRSVYLNGGNKGTNTATVNATTFNQLTLGGINLGIPQYADAYVAEFGAWNAALTDDEAKALGKGFSCHIIRPENLVHHMPLIRSNVAPVGDLAPTNTIGTFPHPPIIGAIAA